MKNLLLVTHGKFAEGIIDAAKIILGELGNIAWVSVTTSETVPVIKQMIADKIQEFQNDAPVVMMTDIAGGSTTQSAISYLPEHEGCYLVSGLSLGLLLDIALLELSEDEEQNKEALRTAIKNACGNTVLVNDILHDTVEDDL